MKSQLQKSLLVVTGLAFLVTGCSGGGANGEQDRTLRNITPPTSNTSTPSIGSGSGSSTIGYSSNETLDDINVKLDEIAKGQKEATAAAKSASKNASSANSKSSWSVGLIAGVLALMLFERGGKVAKNKENGDGLGKAMWKGGALNDSSAADSKQVVKAVEPRLIQTEEIMKEQSGKVASSMSAAGEGMNAMGRGMIAIDQTTKTGFNNVNGRLDENNQLTRRSTDKIIGAVNDKAREYQAKIDSLKLDFNNAITTSNIEQVKAVDAKIAALKKEVDDSMKVASDADKKSLKVVSDSVVELQGQVSEMKKAIDTAEALAKLNPPSVPSAPAPAASPAAAPTAAGAGVTMSVNVPAAPSSTSSNSVPVANFYGGGQPSNPLTSATDKK